VASRSLSPSSFRALRTLARAFRYGTLSELVGQRVRIADVESIPNVLGTLLRPAIGEEPAWKSPDHGTLEAALAKYGLVDATFKVSAHCVARLARQGGFIPLRELGMLTPSEDAQLDESLLLDAVNGFQAGDGFAKIFLCADEPPWRWAELEPSRGAVAARAMLDWKLPSGYLPRDFVVDDACVTNWKVVWCEKHFYL